MYTIFHPPDSWSRKHSKKLQVQKVRRGFTTDIKPSANMFLTLRAAWGERRGREKKTKNTLQPIKPNVKAHLTPAIGFTLVWNDQTVIVMRSVKSSSHDNCSSSTYYRSSCHSHVLTDLPEGELFSSFFQWEMGVFCLCKHSILSPHLQMCFNPIWISS